MLKVENIVYGTKQIEILHGVSLEVKKGEFVGVIGPNGSGKSTLLKNIYRMLTPKAGDIILDGKSLLKMSNRQSGWPWWLRKGKRTLTSLWARWYRWAVIRKNA